MNIQATDDTSPEAMMSETRLMLRMLASYVEDGEVEPDQWCLDRERFDGVSRYTAARFLQNELGIDAGI